MNSTLLAKVIQSPLRAARAFYQNLPIKFKLMLVLNIMILVPLVVISTISYRSTEEALTTKSAQYSQDILRVVGLRLTDCISRLEDVSSELLADKRIFETVDSYDPTGGLLSSYENEILIGGILKNTIATRDGVLSIGILTDRGARFFANDNHARESLRGVLEAKPDLLARVRDSANEAGGLPVWFMDTDGGRVQHILLARTMFHHDTYKQTGLFIVMVNSAYLSDALEGLISSDMQNIRVLSDGGDILLETAEQPVKKERDIASLPDSTGSGWIIDAPSRSLVSYATIQKLGWRTISGVSLDILYADAYEIRRVILISCVIAVAFMSLIGLFMAVDIVGAIAALVTGMERVQRGEDNVRLTLARKDELGFVGEAFNRMVGEISALEKWVYRERLTRREAELKALQSQINPHFLFNTLETINWMAILGNMPEISRTITALSSLMEASIMRSGGCIPFAEELRYIDNFIFILTKRFEDRLSVVRRISPQALTVKLPKLLIQPLVENAVYHGVENAGRVGLVTITAKVEDDLLYVTVGDNGVGLTEREIGEINKRLSQSDRAYFEERDAGKHKSVGLDNVNRRIKLFYGEQYGLRLESKKGEYTRVLVTIPVVMDGALPVEGLKAAEKPTNAANPADDVSKE